MLVHRLHVLVCLFQLNIAKVLEGTMRESKSDPASVRDSSSSSAPQIEHILSKVHWDHQDQLPHLSVADLNAFDQYLLGATALDVSIMITFQAFPTAVAGNPIAEVVHDRYIVDIWRKLV